MCDANFIRKECNYKNDYQCQRKCNMSKLKELYNSELQSYYNNYNEYLRYKYVFEIFSSYLFRENMFIGNIGQQYFRHNYLVKVLSSEMSGQYVLLPETMCQHIVARHVLSQYFRQTYLVDIFSSYIF